MRKVQPKPTNKNEFEFRHLTALAFGNAPTFTSKPLHWFERFTRGAIAERAPVLANRYDREIRTFSTEPFESVFGKFTSSHSFSAPKIDWGFRLSEPQTTKALAKLINESSGAHKKAFLEALKVPNVPTQTNEDFWRNVIVRAEVDRVDLEVLIPEPDGRFRPVLIEAKFGHKLTKGQLSKYNKIRSKDKTLNMERADRILLALDESHLQSLKGKQHSQWRYINWQNFWLRFEKSRPAENNHTLQIFLHTLWHRISQ